MYVVGRTGCAAVLAAVCSALLHGMQLCAQPCSAPRHRPQPCIPGGMYRVGHPWKGCWICDLPLKRQPPMLAPISGIWSKSSWSKLPISGSSGYTVCVVRVCCLCGMGALLNSLNIHWYFCPLNSNVILPARVNCCSHQSSPVRQLKQPGKPAWCQCLL